MLLYLELTGIYLSDRSILIQFYISGHIITNPSDDSRLDDDLPIGLKCDDYQTIVTDIFIRSNGFVISIN